MASQIGLEAISITDHDTLEGTRQALTCDKSPHLQFITGIEISVAAPPGVDIQGGLHVLGYGIDPDNVPLQKVLNNFKAIRDGRTVRILERLADLGLHLTLDQVNAEVGEGTAGRPHVARAMIRAGMAADINDAFDHYLGDGKAAYVGKERLSCGQAFDLIHGAGGIPVLAHPYLIDRRGADAFKSLVAQMCDMGLKGLEAYYPEHTPQATRDYLDVARQFNLLVTGGTDFHGDVTPHIQMGSGRGDLKVPKSIFEALMAARPASHAC